MDLATMLALIILIGTIGLAVVAVLAFVIYRTCVQKNTQAAPTLEPHAPALDVPSPTVPSAPPPADGAPASLDPAPPRVKTEESPQGDQHFLEYDGTTFKPVTPPSWDSQGNGSVASAHPSSNGFAWR